MKCPKCEAECVRDEHPDGYYASPWSCSECKWFEKAQKDMDEIIEADLPFNQP